MGRLMGFYVSSLSVICIRALLDTDLSTLSAHVLSLVVPHPIQRALSRFQRRFLCYLRWKMARACQFQRIFASAALEERLQPAHLERYSVLMGNFAEGLISLVPGNHIVVFLGKYYHHGIYLGHGRVADVNVNRPRALADVSVDAFLARRQGFGVVRYPTTQDVDAFHQGTLDIVRYMMDEQHRMFQTYRVLSENCECFALCCVTRGFLCESQQVHEMLMTIVRDPRFRRDLLDFLVEASEFIVGRFA